MRISVVIPNFNMGKYVEEALRSCMEQTLPPYEIVVSDNASTDDSISIIQRLNVPNLRLIAQPNNVGMFANLNQCFHQVNGDYAKILCSDDVLHSKALEWHVASIASSEATARCLSIGVTHNLKNLGECPLSKDSLYFGPGSVPDILSNSVALSLSDMCYHVETFREFGMYGAPNPAIDYSRDAVIATRFAHRFGLTWTPRKLVFERPHATQNRKNMPRLNQITELISTYTELGILQDPKVVRRVNFIVGNHIATGLCKLLTNQGASYLKQVIHRTRIGGQLRFQQFVRGFMRVIPLALGRFSR